MKMSLCSALCAAALMFAAGAASADPRKDESGKGQWRGSYGWQGDGYAPPESRGVTCRLPASAGSGVQAYRQATSRHPLDVE
jgi:hypothetical protein